MHSRKLLLMAAAVLAIGIAFAAQPTASHPGRNPEDVRERAPWVPGTNMLMSAHETAVAPLAPPH